jgi:hypothetical protein
MTGVTEDIARRREAAPDFVTMQAAIARAAEVFGALCYARARAFLIKGFAERLLLLDGVANEPGRAVGPEHFGLSEGDCVRAIRAAIIERLDGRAAMARELLVGLGASQSSLMAIERAAVDAASAAAAAAAKGAAEAQPPADVGD